MSDFFLACMLVGLGLLVLTFVLDFADAEVEFDDGPDWLNTKALSAGLVGFGGFGYLAAGLPALAAVIFALAGFGIVAFGTLVLVVRPLVAQQSNTLLGRRSYLGRTGRISLPIPQGGSGEVTFHDDNKAVVTQRAVSDTGAPMGNGTPVVIVDLAKDGVVVSTNPLETE